MLNDSDMDGFSSAAVLTNYLRRITLLDTGEALNLTHIFHNGKQHGLGDTDIMKKIRDELKPTLLIVPDASGTDN